MATLISSIETTVKIDECSDYVADSSPTVSLCPRNPIRADHNMPTASSFATEIGTVPISESSWVGLMSGVTAQITVQDTPPPESGLAVSTSALPYAGDGHDDPQTTSGFGVMYSTNAGQSWIDYSTISSATPSGAYTEDYYALAQFNGKLYAGDYTGHISVTTGGNSWTVAPPLVTVHEFVPVLT